MYLEEVSIENFRLFKKLELVLNPGLNVLVGENDSGKTALIDAIRYVLGSNSSTRTFVSETDFHENTGAFSIRMKFSNVEGHAHRFVEHLSHEEKIDENGEGICKPVLYIHMSAKKTGKERRGYPYIQTQIRSGFDGGGPHLESEIHEFLAATYLKPLRDAEAELSPGRGSRLSQILNSSKDVRASAEEILSIVANANELLLNDQGALKKSADNIRENYLHNLIFESDKNTIGVFVDIAGVREKSLAMLPSTAKHRHLRSILEGLSLALTDDHKLHGLGYQNLLFMATELLLLEQESMNEFSLLLIEEPEAHLHPQIQMKLLQFINEKTEKNDTTDGIQCLLTTHSPNLSSKVDPAAIIMFGDGKAWSLRPEETELIPSDYVFLQKFLDATKANVFFAKGLLFVEGAAESILLPKIAELLELPLENFGVSIVKYDNSGSWKRFARLFLRKGCNELPIKWTATRICVLRDLDLWPDQAEEIKGDANPYGFKKITEGNKRYWRKNCEDEACWRLGLIEDLSRQNILVKVADDWTFEFCLAKYGLFEECYEAVKGNKDDIESITGDEDAKATFIQRQVSKTDFAYKLGEILEKQQQEFIRNALNNLSDKQQKDSNIMARTVSTATSEFAKKLKDKLPSYIVKAIEHVTGYADDSTPNTSGVKSAESP